MKKRNDGRYQKKITYEYKGEKKTKTFYGKTIKEVNDKSAHFLSSLSSLPSSLTFGDAWEKYYEAKSKSLRPSTLSAMTTYHKMHLSPLDPIPLERLNNRHLNDIILTMKQKDLSTGTIARIATLAKGIMNYMVNNEYISRNPFTAIDRPKEENKQKRSLTREEQMMILNAPTTHKKIMCMFMMLCGLRLGEAEAVFREDIDMSNKTVSIKRQRLKNGTYAPLKTSASKRTLPLPDIIINEINKLDTDNVVPIHYYRHKELKAYFKRLGLPSEISAHYLRHTYASILYEQDVDVRSAMYLLGHNKITTTVDIYTHISQTKIHNENIKINQYFNSLIV